MARVAVALSCTAQVMAELERLSRSRSGEVRMAERARIVLACLRGKRNDEIADEMGLRPNTVGQWRRRFAQRGIAGLHDAPRSGKPPKYGVELRDRILAQLERSEEHTSELQSLMRISYSDFSLKKKQQIKVNTRTTK